MVMPKLSAIAAHRCGVMPKLFAIATHRCGVMPKLFSIAAHRCGVMPKLFSIAAHRRGVISKLFSIAAHGRGAMADGLLAPPGRDAWCQSFFFRVKNGWPPGPTGARCLVSEFFLQGEEEGDAFSRAAFGRDLALVEMDAVLHDR